MYEKINFYNIGSRLVSFQYFSQFPDQIGIAAVVPPLAPHQVYHESVGCTTVEFRRPVLGKAPDKPEVCALSIPFTWLFLLANSLWLRNTRQWSYPWQSGRTSRPSGLWDPPAQVLAFRHEALP